MNFLLVRFKSNTYLLDRFSKSQQISYFMKIHLSEAELFPCERTEMTRLIVTVNKIPIDATVCRYLFTAKLLYMFRVSQHPSSGVLKTVPAASGTGHTTCIAIPLLRGLIWTGCASRTNLLFNNFFLKLRA